MNVINTNSIVQNQSANRLRSNRQAERQTIRTDQTNPNSKEQTNHQNETIRVIRVASDGLKIAEFGSKYKPNSNGQASAQRKPEEQYQSTQQLLERDEVGGLLEIDLFA